VLTSSTTITTIHFLLHFVSAEFQTSRSEERHWRTWRNPSLLDSYLYNLPSSAKYSGLQCHKHCKDSRLQIIKQSKMQYIRNSGVLQMYLILHWHLGAFANLRKATIYLVLFVCPSVRLAAWNNSASNGQIFWKQFLENLSNICCEKSILMKIRR
jgi:hypothetical protein